MIYHRRRTQAEHHAESPIRSLGGFAGCLKMFHKLDVAVSSAELWQQAWTEGDFAESARFCNIDPLRPLFDRNVHPGSVLHQGVEADRGPHGGPSPAKSSLFQYAYTTEEFKDILGRQGFRVRGVRGYSILWGLYELPFWAGPWPGPPGGDIDQPNRSQRCHQRQVSVTPSLFRPRHRP